MTTNAHRMLASKMKLRHNEQLYLNAKKQTERAMYLKNVKEFSKQFKRFETLTRKEVQDKFQYDLFNNKTAGAGE